MPGTVYVIDDDAGVRCSVEFLIQCMGLEVVSFETGSAFLDAIGHPKEGCVLIDLMLPDMNGLEIQRELIRRGITLPVVIITGHGDEAARDKAISQGAVAYLNKPYQTDDLQNLIERLVRCGAGEE